MAFFSRMVVAAGLGGAALLGQGPAAAEPVARVGAAIEAMISGGVGQLSVDGRTLDRAALEQLYLVRDYRPIWLEDEAGSAHASLTARGEAVRAALAGADREGLDPARYRAAEIAARVGSADRAALAELDLLITDSLVRYAVEVRTGVVAPSSVDRENLIAPPRVDGVLLAESVARAPDVAARMAALAPPHPEYARLRDGLARMREAARAGGWPRIGEGPTLRPGMSHPNVPALRRRLAATGEYRGPAGPSELYDAALEAAVRAFQERHGLGVDGVVGPRTRAQMDVSAAERVAQVVANMERWRWLPDDLGARHVAVNIPGFWLTAVEDGRTALEMPVIVGTAVRRTPILASTITSTTFNPTWTVPLRNAREDILPKVLQDPSYLDQQGIRVFSSWQADAQLLDHRTMDWRGIGRGIGRFRLVQQPGPLNALGRFKFNIPNDHDIYLHDTPQQEKFDSAHRSFSSGCVRVGDPEGLNAWLFSTHAGWSADRTRDVLESGRTRTVRLAAPVPVYLLYQTARADAAGRLVFHEDVYGRDARLAEAVRRSGEPRTRAAQAGG
jgi:murein L,D-transpeptidase YcbB/YkuD